MRLKLTIMYNFPHCVGMLLRDLTHGTPNVPFTPPPHSHPHPHLHPYPGYGDGDGDGNRLTIISLIHELVIILTIILSKRFNENRILLPPEQTNPLPLSLSL